MGKRNTLKSTENKQIVTSGERKEGKSKIGCEIKSYQLLCKIDKKQRYIL